MIFAPGTHVNVYGNGRPYQAVVESYDTRTGEYVTRTRRTGAVLIASGLWVKAAKWK